jgi:hypothetical protein
LQEELIHSFRHTNIPHFHWSTSPCKIRKNRIWAHLQNCYFYHCIILSIASWTNSLRHSNRGKAFSLFMWFKVQKLNVSTVVWIIVAFACKFSLILQMYFFSYRFFEPLPSVSWAYWPFHLILVVLLVMVLGTKPVRHSQGFMHEPMWPHLQV